LAENPARLRILQVVPNYYPAVRYGGPIRSVHGLAAALARRGHDIHVYTTSLDGPAELDVPLDRPVDLDGVKVHYFRVPALRRLFWSPGLSRRLRQSVGGFDAVHVHAVYVFPPLAAARAAARCHVPYVLAPRGMLIREAINRKSRWIKTAWINCFERKSLERAAAIHVTAEMEATELGWLGLPMRHVACIPNGVQFPRDDQPLPVGPYSDLPPRFVLFLSRINWKKGLDRLIAAWRFVPDTVLVIAGNDEEGYQAKLLQQVRELGLSDRVIFLGPVEDAHKWALFNRAQLFVLPSYSENFGNVVAEAMSMGCPVAVTPEVGIADLVESVGAGIVADGEPGKFSSAIRAILSRPADLRAMGQRGRRAARDRLSWDAVAAETETLYRAIIQKQQTLGAAS
jgi:glycosyltransferase involved in cell wall biosynthesis